MAATHLNDCKALLSSQHGKQRADGKNGTHGNDEDHSMRETHTQTRAHTKHTRKTVQVFMQ